MVKKNLSSLLFCMVLLSILSINNVLLAKNSNSIGLKIGLNYSDFYGKFAENWDPINGIQLGTFYNIYINNYLSIQPEIMFSQKGSEIDELYSSGYRYHFKAKANYLEASFLIKLHIPFLRTSIGPSIYLGPIFSYKLKSITSGSYPDPLAVYGILKINEKYDTGFIFGTSVNSPMLLRNLIIDLRYNLGLIAIDEYGDIFNHVFTVSLGYKLCNY